MPGVTVNLLPLDAFPAAVVTVIRPVEALSGIVVMILVGDLTLKRLGAELNVTRFVPVNPEPMMVTLVPMGPEAGLKEVITGAATVTALPAATSTAQGTSMSTATRNACKRISSLSVDGSTGNVGSCPRRTRV